MPAPPRWFYDPSPRAHGFELADDLRRAESLSPLFSRDALDDALDVESRLSLDVWRLVASFVPLRSRVRLAGASRAWRRLGTLGADHGRAAYASTKLEATPPPPREPRGAALWRWLRSAPAPDGGDDALAPRVARLLLRAADALPSSPSNYDAFERARARELEHELSVAKGERRSAALLRGAFAR